MTKKENESSEQSELLDYLKCIKSDIGSVKTDIGSVKSDMADTEKRLGDKLENKFDELKDQISDMRSKQETEVKARKELEVKVNDMQEQFNTLHAKIDQNTNAEAIAEAMESKIEEVVARQMKSKDNQINATYYQSLANELKNHEKDLMIYGFQTSGSPDLEGEIRQKLFKDKLDTDIGQFKAVQVGSGIGGKPKPIRASFLSTEIRNTVCRQSSKLPQNIKIEKCLPQRYRHKHRDFRKYAWQLREGADVQARVVFKGHKLVLEFKQHDDGPDKFDWSIAKEYFPQPVSPTDKTEAERDRQGLKVSKTIEQIGTNKVILSKLTVNADLQPTMAYFKNNYLEPSDRDKISTYNTNKLLDKNMLIVSLPSKQDCARFKEKYEKREFNGQKPDISVMLGIS